MLSVWVRVHEFVQGHTPLLWYVLSENAVYIMQPGWCIAFALVDSSLLMARASKKWQDSKKNTKVGTHTQDQQANTAAAK